MADSNLSLSEHRLESVFLAVADAVVEWVLVLAMVLALAMVVGWCVLWQHSHNEEQRREERRGGEGLNGAFLSIVICLSVRLISNCEVE